MLAKFGVNRTPGVLRPSLRVGGCCIHPLSGTVSVNDSARANTSIEPGWMDVREVSIRWKTRKLILDGMTE